MYAYNTDSVKHEEDSSQDEVLSQIYNVHCRRFTMYASSLFSGERKKGCDICVRHLLSSGLAPFLSFSRMDSETKKRRCSLSPRDTPDILSQGEQMEEPSSFDESLVRNGRLHRAPYCRRRAREIYETAGIVRHVTETEKTRNYSPISRL